MKNNSRQQEILLMISSSFSRREWNSNNTDQKQEPLSKREQLKVACWDGLVPQMLPECFEHCYDNTLHLWEMNEANAFIDLEYGETVPKIERKYSVNPYVFLTVQDYN